MKDIKIAIVDDHEFFRSGLKIALKRISNVICVFEASNGEEFIDKLKTNQIDMVLMDIKMPLMDGYQTTQLVRKNYPDIKIIILTMFDMDEYVQKLLEAGVNAFILKNINKNELEKVIITVNEGKQYFSNELMPFFTRQMLDKSNKSSSNVDLTNRELEIIQLICDGYSNKEIAEKLFISIRTVTNHRANLNSKTESKNTAGLISYAIKNKLINK
jgi:DNA-binding NarL/FixJ family response regulator